MFASGSKSRDFLYLHGIGQPIESVPACSVRIAVLRAVITLSRRMPKCEHPHYRRVKTARSHLFAIESALTATYKYESRATKKIPHTRPPGIARTGLRENDPHQSLFEERCTTIRIYCYLIPPWTRSSSIGSLCVSAQNRCMWRSDAVLVGTCKPGPANIHKMLSLALSYASNA